VAVLHSSQLFQPREPTFRDHCGRKGFGSKQRTYTSCVDMVRKEFSAFDKTYWSVQGLDVYRRADAGSLSGLLEAWGFAVLNLFALHEASISKSSTVREGQLRRIPWMKGNAGHGDFVLNEASLCHLARQLGGLSMQISCKNASRTLRSTKVPQSPKCTVRDRNGQLRHG